MDTPVIPTGFRALDDLIEGGFKAGELILFSSSMQPALRPSYGACGLGMQMLLQHVRNGGSVMYYNYEGPPIR